MQQSSSGPEASETGDPTAKRRRSGRQQRDTLSSLRSMIILTSYRPSSFYPTRAVLQAAVALIQEYLEEGGSVDDMFLVLEPLCVFFLNQSFGYYGPYMCPGVIHSYGPVVSSVSLHSHFVHVYSSKGFPICYI